MGDAFWSFSKTSEVIIDRGPKSVENLANAQCSMSVMLFLLQGWWDSYWCTDVHITTKKLPSGRHLMLNHWMSETIHEAWSLTVVYSRMVVLLAEIHPCLTGKAQGISQSSYIWRSIFTKIKPRARASKGLTNTWTTTLDPNGNPWIHVPWITWWSMDLLGSKVVTEGIGSAKRSNWLVQRGEWYNIRNRNCIRWYN